MLNGDFAGAGLQSSPSKCNSKMSSPMYSLKNGKKPPLLPGRRGAPFKSHEQAEFNLEEHEMLNTRPRGRNKEANHASKVPNDTELLSSVMQRLAKAEQNLKSCHEIIKEKDKRLRLLDEKCKIMEKARGYGDEKVLILEKKCQSLQSQVHSMESFLEDYGMKWVGENEDDGVHKFPSDGHVLDENNQGRSDFLMSSQNSVWNPMSSMPTTPKPFKMDFDLVVKNVEELNAIAGAGEHEISHTTRGARLKIRDPVPLTLYANGIFMFNGPFRPYTDLETQTCVQDLMDGYFPSELQPRYPNGVPILLKDQRSTVFRDKRQEKFFTGTGNQLVSESKEIVEHTLVRKDKASDTKELQETSQPPAEQRQTVDQFLNKLPTSVVKAGRIVDVRSGLEETLKGSQKSNEDSVIVVDTTAKISENSISSEAENSANNITTLRIKSERGDKTFVLKMKYTNTIGDVRRQIEKIRSVKSSNYQLKTSFPNRTYDRIHATLEECELVPNATLHLLVKR